MDYKSQRWRNLRQRVLARDRWLCRECRRYGVAREATVAHHVRPAESFPELQWVPENLIALCSACHNAMHARGGHELSELGRAWARRIPPPEAPRGSPGGNGKGWISSDAAANGGGGSGPGPY